VNEQVSTLYTHGLCPHERFGEEASHLFLCLWVRYVRIYNVLSCELYKTMIESLSWFIRILCPFIYTHRDHRLVTSIAYRVHSVFLCACSRGRMSVACIARCAKTPWARHRIRPDGCHVFTLLTQFKVVTRTYVRGKLRGGQKLTTKRQDAENKNWTRT
jgi:hypothetical protein